MILYVMSGSLLLLDFTSIDSLLPAAATFCGHLHTTLPEAYMPLHLKKKTNQALTGSCYIQFTSLLVVKSHSFEKIFLAQSKRSVSIFGDNNID